VVWHRGTLFKYVADAATKPTFAAEVDGRLVGFITLTQHFPQAWEVHCMAVAADIRNCGVGTALLERAERYASDQGARFLQVKTVAQTSPSPEYAETGSSTRRRASPRLRSSRISGTREILRYN
jgi:GNAT superfamily N-acetyltransferase